jgi:hypothetical protein
MLPQLIVFGAMCAACWFGAKWLREEFARVEDEMKRAERMLQRIRSGGPAPLLRLNPRTGRYRSAD